MSDVAAAVQSTEPEKFQTDRVTTISAAHAVHDTYSAFLNPLLPVFIETLALSKAQAGSLTVFLQGPSLLQPFIGYLGDRISLRYLVILAPAVTATVMSLIGFAPTYAILAMMLMVVGLSSAGLHAIAPVMAGRLSGNSLGKGMGFWMVGGELGRTLGPLVIVAAIQFVGLKGAAWLMVGGWLTSLLLYLLLKDVKGQPTNIGQRMPWRRALRVMGPLLIPLVGIVVARSFMSSALTTYLPVFLTEEGAALWFAGVSLSVLEAAGVVGALMGGSLSDRWGRKTILFISFVTTPLLMFIFLVASGWLRFPLLLGLGFTSLSVTPVIMALVQESFPENRALANGIYMSLGFALRSFIIVLVGVMGDTWGMRQAFTICAFIALLGLPVLLLLPKEQRS